METLYLCLFLVLYILFMVSPSPKKGGGLQYVDGQYKNLVTLLWIIHSKVLSTF